MAPSIAPHSDTPSQADTPMTDGADEPIPSVPVDSVDANMTVGIPPLLFSIVPALVAHIQVSVSSVLVGIFFLADGMGHLRATKILRTTRYCAS